MAKKADRINAIIAKQRAELQRQHPHHFKAKLKHTPEECRARIALGKSGLGSDICVETERRFAHAATFGLTGSGKTVYFERLVRQDILARHGVLVIDPHGGDPGSPADRDSLFARLVKHCHDIDLHKLGRLHIIEPSLDSHAVSFNPLIPPSGFDVPTSADDVLKAVERVWGEDSNQTPVNQGMMLAVVSALMELRLTLNEASLLLEREPGGFRAQVIERLKDPTAIEWLSRLELYSKDRNKQQFDVYASAAFTRFSRFKHGDAIRSIIGQTDRQIDLLKIMDEGHVCLVNLQKTGTFSEDKARLVGSLLFRYLYRLSSRRRTRRPFFVYVDEAPLFLTDDVERLFPEIRKYKIGIHVGLQYLRQLGEEGEAIREAILSSSAMKTIFRLSDAKDGHELVDRFLPIDHERPVSILTRPTAVGQEIIYLENETAGTSAGTGTAQGLTNSKGRSASRSITEMDTDSEAHGTNLAEAIADGITGALGESVNDATGVTTMYVPNPASANGMPTGFLDIAVPIGVSRSLGAGHATTSQSAWNRARSKMKGESNIFAHAHSIGESISAAESVARAISRIFSESQSKSETKGRSQALATVYKMLPTAIHSRDTVIDMMARDIMGQDPGVGIVAHAGHAFRIQVPFKERAPIKRDELSRIIREVLATVPEAAPKDQVLAAINERARALIPEKIKKTEKTDPETFDDEPLLGEYPPPPTREEAGTPELPNDSNVTPFRPKTDT